MKIRVERDVLSDAVAWTARVLPSRPTNPVLSGVLLDAGDEHVTMSSSDHAQSAYARLDAVVEESGKAVVSGRLLADIAKSLPNQPVSMVTEGSRLALRCGRASFALPTLPVEDYPELPGMPDVVGRVSGAEFAEAVGQVAVAASRDDTLPVLTGIRMEFTGNAITLAATDRYRLAVRELSWQPASSTFEANALIRAKTLADVARPLSSAASIDIAMDGEPSMIGFAGLGRSSVTSLLDGDFPPYRRLLPTESSSVVHVRTADLIEAVKRVKLVNDRPTAALRLTFGGGEVQLRAGGGEDAQASEGLECEIAGDDLEISFNPDYLLDGLSAVDAETASIALTGPTRPAVISAHDAGEVFRYLLMSVRLGH